MEYKISPGEDGRMRCDNCADAIGVGDSPGHSNIFLIFCRNADSAVVNEADGKTYFVKPHETNMPFDTFIRHLQSQAEDETEQILPVMYSQSREAPSQLESE